MAPPRSQQDGVNGRTSSPSVNVDTLPPPDELRQFTRSPHPYHRVSSKLLEPRVECHPPERDTTNCGKARWTRTPRTSSDSGTEADDESNGFLKGLPAPPARARKGLRTTVGIEFDDPSFWLSNTPPWALFVRSPSRGPRRSRSSEESLRDSTSARELTTRRRRNEVLRRLGETALLLSVGVVGFFRQDVRSLALSWHRELRSYASLILALYALYPIRISFWRGNPRITFSLSIPSSFDPAPLLYPPLIPVLVSLSLSHCPALVLPNIVLALSSVPPEAVPLSRLVHGFSLSHWAITAVPILISERGIFDSCLPTPLRLKGLDPESLLLLYPLQQTLIPTLSFLLTTSLLPAEIHLLGAGLINLVLFSESPQAKILTALIWLGGLCIFVLCREVLRWEVTLARVPSWKFRRAPSSASSSARSLLNYIDHKICERISDLATHSEDPGSDSDTLDDPITPSRERQTSLPRQNGFLRRREPVSAIDGLKFDDLWPSSWASTKHFTQSHKRRHTISTLDEIPPTRSGRPRTTPGGRRKRSMAPGLASFLAMTAPQARIRRWLYAAYIYAAVLFIILLPVRKYIAEKALHGVDPFGWALGYLLGNLSLFRFYVLLLNLDHWIPLPPRLSAEDTGHCHRGWVEHLRQDTFGAANTRLLVSAYFVVVLAVGMALVLRLSKVVEVDTRRKVFHGMMVLMFLPVIFIDPTFSALALALMLAIFLLLDLFRAAQVPPIAKPLTYFLAPYTDGRDHRGPVIVSHLFLLIGCAIPLWLSLADLPRVGDTLWSGWDVPARDVSMVSGIICVGMGDAAASLIGRRFGRLKWFWGGGKSLEGSVAFAVAVSLGLIVARIWLSLGGWQFGGHTPWWWSVVVMKSLLAAGGASLTEAVLTGGNDNVIVPVVLWLLVRGLDI